MTRSAFIHTMLKVSVIMFACQPPRAMAADTMILPYDVSDSMASPYEPAEENGDLSSMKHLMANDKEKNVNAEPKAKLTLAGFAAEGQSEEFMQGFSLCPGCTVVIQRQPTYSEEMARAETILEAIKAVEQQKDAQKYPLAMPAAVTPKAPDQQNTPVLTSGEKIELPEESAVSTAAHPAAVTADGPAASSSEQLSGLDVKL